MVTEEQEEITAIIPATLDEIVPPESTEPQPPQAITEREAQEFQHRAADLVKELESASGSQELELIDNLTHVGMQAQRIAGSNLGLLRGRVRDMMASEGTGNEIAKDLVELRVALNEINPNEMSKPGIVRRVFSIIPFSSHFTPAVRMLERIAIRYEPVSRQVTMIETRLREGRSMLVRDNIELRKLYEQIEEQQLPIQKNAYLGELVMSQLNGVIERTDDTLRVERLRNALHGVSTQVQDLRVMEVVHVQFFVGIEMSRQNNNRLGQSVERTLTLATNVVTVGLAIQRALEDQRLVLEATKRTQEFLGDMIVANAANIRQHTEAIGDIYNSPVIAIEKITQAHNDLMEAMDIADRLKQEGIDSARVNITKLSNLSTEMQQRAGALVEQQTEFPSIEA